MYTQCPECLTIYKISPQALAQGRGSVICGHCTAVFDALRTLSGHQPHEAMGELAVQPASAELPRLSTAMLRPQLQSDLLGDDITVIPLAPRDAPAPQFARARKIGPASPIWPWLAAIAALLILLLGQIAYAERHQLLRSVSVRPWLERACAELGCRLPLAHDIEALSLLSRDVRQHPSVPNALIISAMLRNDDAVTQAFPIVQITLADVDERRIAMRRFTPAEYVGDSRTITDGLPPGATSALVFEVADPGKNAVAFEFKFL